MRRVSPDLREKRVSLALKATRANVVKKEKPDLPVSLALKATRASMVKKEKPDLRDLPGLQDQPVPLVQVHQ